MKLSNTRLFALITILSLSTLGFGQAPSTTAKNQTERGTATKTSEKKAVTPAAIQTELEEALALVQGNYVDAKTLSYNEVFKSSIESMLHTPRSAFELF